MQVNENLKDEEAYHSLPTAMSLKNDPYIGIANNMPALHDSLLQKSGLTKSPPSKIASQTSTSLSLVKPEDSFIRPGHHTSFFHTFWVHIICYSKKVNITLINI